jgi:TonB family protein
MSRFLTTLMFCLVFAAVLLGAARKAMSQNVANSDSPQTGVALVNVSYPIYPPVAREAHITGDVEVMIGVRKDGSVESAIVASGPPLLRPAALDSVQRSRFECRNCNEEINNCRLVYTFKIEGDCSCDPRDGNSNQRDQPYSQITEAQHRVTVTAHTICTCDPASDFKKRRSLKCLYLWRCGS